MAFTGLDSEQVRQLAAQLNNKAGEIENILTQLTSQLNGVNWIGGDAERFKGEWSGTHTAQLKQVISALHQASQTATQNAQEQETASR